MGKSKYYQCRVYKESVGQTVVDRISQLPDDVIDKILTSLPIVEAARTSVLSRNWKRVWRNISVLVFDSSFGKKFKKAGLRRTLLLDLGAIDGFTLSIPWLESCDEIDLLIQFLFEKKIKHLKIHLRDGDVHILPSYLYSCFHLSTLDLALCEINPLPCSFGGFCKLITLVLKHVDIDKDIFGMLFSKCPLLQHVELQKCCFGEVSSIDIIAPNLRTFLYNSCKLIIYFVSAPLLDQLQLFESDYKCRVGSLLNFDRLKKLHLDEFCTSTPALRILDIDGDFLKMPDYDTLDLLPNSLFEILEPGQYDVSCNRLQTVELFDFNGTDPEMEIVMFFLSKSPQLKTMTIHQASKDDEKGMQIPRKMIRFQRASAVVEIIFNDADE